MGADGNAAASGSTARYEEVLEGVDAAYTATPDFVKEDLILADRDAVRDFTYSISASAGVVPKLRPGGTVEFVDGAGKVKFTFAAPFMRDAAGAESRAVEVGLDPAGSGWSMTVRADDAWLDASERAWPVVLDPA